MESKYITVSFYWEHSYCYVCWRHAFKLVSNQIFLSLKSILLIFSHSFNLPPEVDDEGGGKEVSWVNGSNMTTRNPSLWLGFCPVKLPCLFRHIEKHWTRRASLVSAKVRQQEDSRVVIVWIIFELVIWTKWCHSWSFRVLCKNCGVNGRRLWVPPLRFHHTVIHTLKHKSIVSAHGHRHSSWFLEPYL